MRNVLRSLLLLLLLAVPAAAYSTPTFTPQLSPFTGLTLAPVPHHATHRRAHRPVIPRHRVPVRMIDETTDATQCMAIAIYREARGESDAGMAGVGYLVLNRVKNKHFKSKTVCGIIREPGQFSWVRHTPKGKINAKSYARATRIAKQVLAGTIANPIGDAIFFHARRLHRGSPSRYAPYRIALGNHAFFGPTPVRAVLLAATRT